MFAHLRRHAQRCPRLVEAAFLLLVCAATGNQYHRAGTGTVWWPGFAVAGIVCAGLVVRRRHPGTVVALTTLGTVLAGSRGCVFGPLLLLPVIVALYELALRSGQRAVLSCCLGVVLVLLPTALRWDPEGDPWADEVVSLAFWILLPALHGSAVRVRRAYLDAVRARAEQAERILEEEARHRVYEERIRIARELHDVVAHHMALANAQAGTAAHLCRTRPEEAHTMLAELTVTTTGALRELQATVGLLRRSDTGEDPLEPAPGLDRLDDLIAAFATAGLHVTVDTDGPPRPLPAGIDLTAYRIVQEALTNVAKHAAVSTAHIRLTYTRDRLSITVRNEGSPLPRPRAPGGGFGLVGMRERARSAGGRLSAGHRPEGGFAVTADLPLPT